MTISILCFKLIFHSFQMFQLLSVKCNKMVTFDTWKSCVAFFFCYCIFSYLKELWTFIFIICYLANFHCSIRHFRFHMCTYGFFRKNWRVLFRCTEDLFDMAHWGFFFLEMFNNLLNQILMRMNFHIEF